MLDWYLTFSQRFIFLVAVEHCVIKLVVRDDLVDRVLCLVTWAVFACTQIVWYWYVRKTVQSEEEKLRLSYEQIDEWMDKKSQKSSSGQLLSLDSCTLTTR